MKNILQKGHGWPVLILALVLGFGGAAWSATAKNHWPFIIGFGLDVLLVIGYILTCDEEGEPNQLMNQEPKQEEPAAEETAPEPAMEAEPPAEEEEPDQTPAAE